MRQSPQRIVSLLEGEAVEAASYAFWGMGVTLCTHIARPEEPEDTPMYVARLAQSCDILVLPLSLCRKVSLYIARQVHQQRVPFRTVLFTGSFTATAQTTTPLFDYSLSNRSVGLFDTLKQAALTPTPPRQTIDAVEHQIFQLLRKENCFDPLRLPQALRLSLGDMLARDMRYSAAMDELALFQAGGQACED